MPPLRPRSHSSSICGNPTIEAAMVADAHPQPQRQPLQPPSSSPEDEALKRNTDCVYFLASPLTCKKGSECEYRHSEYARVNPRDCWFWLNSNCLNPKCSFRHPPLDGLLGNQAEISSGSSLAPSQPAVSAAIHVPCSASKQAVPCIFFQQGMCFKGDRCAFLHGPNPINKPPQASTAPSLTQPPSFKRVFGSLVKCAQGQKVSQPSITTPVEPPNAKPFGKPENTPLRTEALVPENLPPSMALGAEGRFKQSTGPAIVNGSTISQSNHMHQSLVSDDHSFQNGKDADESIRESSPGFDVLVDDELRDADYYHDEDQYGRMRGRDGQFDLVCPSDFNSMVDIERERLHDPRGFDSYEREQHRASSERNFVGNTARVDRRRSYPKVENPDQIDESDLRHRLSKQRRVSGVRSVICHDYDRERHIEERSYRGPHRDSPRDSALSNRFRGRINLPRKSSPTRGSDLHLRRDSDKGRSRARSSPSPGKLQISSQLGRLRDRIKGVADEDFVRRPPISRGITDDTSTDFAGPKSLAELKGGRNVENKEQSFSSRNLLFKGPKPLDVILKRKQEADAGSSANTMHNNEGSINKENNSNDERALNDEEERKSAVDAAAEEAEKTTLACGKSSNGVGPEEGVIEDGEEDQEPGAYDQREGEYDYEHNLDGEEYDINGGENAEYLEGEEEEDDDGDDDFAKKIGVMFT